MTEPMIPNLWTLSKVQQETHDTYTLELKSSNGDFSFKPGQFNMLYLFGTGEVPISISGNPKKKKILTHTLRRVGTVTKAISLLKKGQALGVRGPFGTDWPVKEAENKDLLLIAGGIGLAPLRPALYQVASERKKYNRVTLLYGARTPADLLYEKEFSVWANTYKIEVHTTVDRASQKWQGNVGVVTTLIKKTSLDPENTLAMMCGPEIMMRFCLRELKQMGLASEKIYISMERNMKCGIGFCGHCQYGPAFICKEGPVFRFDKIETWFSKSEL